MPAVPVALARPANRHLVRLITAFAAVLTFAALLLAGGPASAHDQLLSSDPEDGATLGEHPASISLTFSATPLDTGIELVVVGPDGATAQGTDIQVDGEVVTVQLDEDLPPGAYDVAWHVVSSDGHPIDGELSYTVKGAADTAGSGADSTGATGSVEEPNVPTELAGAGDGSDIGGLAVTGGIVAAVLVVLGAVVMMRRKILENDRLRGTGEPSLEEPGDDKSRNENPDGK